MTRWKLFWAIAVTVFFSTAVIAKESAPVPVEQLVKSPPHELHHVLVVGQVDNCSGFGCNLCPSDMTQEAVDWNRCLSLSFEGFPHNIPGVNYVDVSGLMENAFRFATVVMEADYDPTCRMGMASNKHEDEIVVCTDRASVIVNARVVKVLSRKTAQDGLRNNDWGKLVDPDQKDGTEMSRLIIAGYPAERAVKLFQIQGYPYLVEEGLVAVGLGCFCTKTNCANDWPQHYFLGFESPANPFQCVRMEKRPAGWRIPINN